jgi:hypothetical protein
MTFSWEAVFFILMKEVILRSSRSAIEARCFTSDPSLGESDCIEMSSHIYRAMRVGLD